MLIPNTSPVKKRKNKYSPKSTLEIAKLITKEAELNGFSSVDFEGVWGILKSTNVFINKHAKIGKPFFLSYLGYFTPTHQRLRMIKKIEKVEAQQKLNYIKSNNNFKALERHAHIPKSKFLKINNELLSKNKIPITWYQYCKDTGYIKREKYLMDQKIKLAKRIKKFISILNDLKK